MTNKIKLCVGRVKHRGTALIKGRKPKRFQNKEEENRKYYTKKLTIISFGKLQRIDLYMGETNGSLNSDFVPITVFFLFPIFRCAATTPERKTKER